jgi:Membrane-bound metallopeptidase
MKITIFVFRLFKMKKKNSRFSRFIKKVRFKYRVSILNENTLIESWHVRLSRFSVFLYVSVFTIITFVLLTLLILNTPIRYYLPGYEDSGNRIQIIKESMRADSLQRQMNLQAIYLDVVKGVITGEFHADSLVVSDSLEQVSKMKDLIEKSKREKEFCEKFEEKEKFNLLVLNTKIDEDSYVFFRPNRGTISSRFNLQEQQYGIRMLTAPNENILSIFAGTVIYAAYTIESEWAIIVQHENNYLSVYKNNARLLRKAGDMVKAGETIAIAPNVTNNTTEQFYFELWKDGHAVNPEEYIIF